MSEGPTNERGPKGDHGQHGDEGTRGEVGLTGAPGAPGTPGMPGTPGASGAEGRVGKQGDAGIEGEQGEQGVEGAQGRRGPPGATGAKGEKGESGTVARLNRFRTSTFGVILFYGYLLAILASASLVGKTVLDNRGLVKESHRVLCSQKQEREQRVADTARILAKPNDPDNERIIATFGRPLLLRSLALAKADLESYRDAKC